MGGKSAENYPEQADHLQSAVNKSPDAESLFVLA